MLKERFQKNRGEIKMGCPKPEGINHIKISIIQPEFIGWNFDLMFEKCERLVKSVLPESPDMILLPEVFPGKILRHSEYLWNLKVPIFFGHSLPCNGKWQNCYSLKVPGNEEIYSQGKLVLAEEEADEYLEGKEVNIFHVNNLKIGVAICHVLPFAPSALEAYYKSEIDLLIVPALAPFYHLEYWERFLMVRSMEMGVPIVFINYSGRKKYKGIYYGGGGSCLVMPLPGHLKNFKQFIQATDINPDMNFCPKMKNEEGVKTVTVRFIHTNYRRERLRQYHRINHKIKTTIVDVKL